MNKYVLKAELINNVIWKINTFDLKIALSQEKNVYLIDPYSQYSKSSYSYFELYKYKEIDENEFPFIYLDFDDNEKETLPEYILKILIIVNCHWVNILWESLTNEKFLEYVSSAENIHIWSAFILNPYKLKGIIVSEYSYPSPHNNGIALSTFEKTKPKSLLAIEENISPYCDFGWSLKQDLVHIQTQGIMLWNKDLLYNNFDYNFFIKVFRFLKTLKLQWLLLGSGLFYLREELDESSVILEEHPVEALKRKEMYNTKAFKVFGDKLNLKW